MSSEEESAPPNNSDQIDVASAAPSDVVDKDTNTVKHDVDGTTPITPPVTENQETAANDKELPAEDEGSASTSSTSSPQSLTPQSHMYSSSSSSSSPPSPTPPSSQEQQRDDGETCVQVVDTNDYVKEPVTVEPTTTTTTCQQSDTQDASAAVEETKDVPLSVTPPVCPPESTDDEIPQKHETSNMDNTTSDPLEPKHSGSDDEAMQESSSSPPSNNESPSDKAADSSSNDETITEPPENPEGRTSSDEIPKEEASVASKESNICPETVVNQEHTKGAHEPSGDDKSNDNTSDNDTTDEQKTKESMTDESSQTTTLGHSKDSGESTKPAERNGDELPKEQASNTPDETDVVTEPVERTAPDEDNKADETEVSVEKGEGQHHVDTTEKVAPVDESGKELGPPKANEPEEPDEDMHAETIDDGASQEKEQKPEKVMDEEKSVDIAEKGEPVAESAESDNEADPPKADELKETDQDMPTETIEDGASLQEDPKPEEVEHKEKPVEAAHDDKTVEPLGNTEPEDVPAHVVEDTETQESGIPSDSPAKDTPEDKPKEQSETMKQDEHAKPAGTLDSKSHESEKDTGSNMEGHQAEVSEIDEPLEEPVGRTNTAEQDKEEDESFEAAGIQSKESNSEVHPIDVEKEEWTKEAPKNAHDDDLSSEPSDRAKHDDADTRAQKDQKSVESAGKEKVPEELPSIVATQKDTLEEAPSVEFAGDVPSNPIERATVQEGNDGLSKDDHPTSVEKEEKEYADESSTKEHAENVRIDGLGDTESPAEQSMQETGASDQGSESAKQQPITPEHEEGSSPNVADVVEPPKVEKGDSSANEGTASFLPMGGGGESLGDSSGHGLMLDSDSSDEETDLLKLPPMMSVSKEEEQHRLSLLSHGQGHKRWPSTILEEASTSTDDPRQVIQSVVIPSSSVNREVPVSPQTLKRSPVDDETSSLAGTHGSLKKDAVFVPCFVVTKCYQHLSSIVLSKHCSYSPFDASATWIGFWALFHVTCANYVLTPLRDAVALQVGVQHMPLLTLASTVLAFCSSVPIGWLFEAPDPSRRRLWKRMGLTRGETQGTSLALFYRCFAFSLLMYAVGFQLLEWNDNRDYEYQASYRFFGLMPSWVLGSISMTLYVAFFLVVHLMKLHSLSLVWGVTTEAMEYEEVARRKSPTHMESNKARLQRLALVGFGGTIGGILGRYVKFSLLTSRPGTNLA